MQTGGTPNSTRRYNTGRLIMKIIPADDTIAELERKACECEEQAEEEFAPIANFLREKAKLCREWITALTTGKWTS
jgi:hypothetical protein